VRAERGLKVVAFARSADNLAELAPSTHLAAAPRTTPWSFTSIGRAAVDAEKFRALIAVTMSALATTGSSDPSVAAMPHIAWRTAPRSVTPGGERGRLAARHRGATARGCPVRRAAGNAAAGFVWHRRCRACALRSLRPGVSLR
jgi:hypothetical protein